MAMAEGTQVPGMMVFRAPHRAMFLGGCVMLLASFALWAVEIGARAGFVGGVTWMLPPAWMHALLILCGVFPFFIFGFLLTAMPRWQGLADLSVRDWSWAWRLLAVGWCVSLAGMLLPGALVPGLVLVLAGWVILLRVLGGVALHRHPDRVHALITFAALTAGCVALGAWLPAIVMQNAGWARFATQAGLWWFLLPVFFTVCHRMVPFFSSNVIKPYVVVRPRWAFAVVAASVIHGGLAMVGYEAYAWIVDAPAACIALWLSWKWRLVAALKVALLGMLHVGFAWLGVGLMLFAIQGFAAMFDTYLFGLAPLHSIGLGFFGSILLAMVSRVTLGHSGQALKADRLTVMLFAALQLVSLARIGADIGPASLSNGLMAASVAAWCLVFSAWAIRYAPSYWRARVDGKPG